MVEQEARSGGAATGTKQEARSGGAATGTEKPTRSGGAATEWELFVFEYARSRNQPVASLIHGAFTEGVIDLPFSFVLARRGERNVLVDCGFMNEGGGAEMAIRFDVPWWVSPVKMLAEFGVLADSVSDIVLSHAHFDHMGSIGEFRKAALHMQRREYLSWMEALALPRQYGSITAVVHPEHLRSAFDASLEHRLKLVDGDVDNLLPGIHVRSGEGHTLGQQFIIVETARGRVVVSGDCIYGARNILGNNNDGVYIPLGAGVGSTWDQVKTIDRINAEIGGDMSRLVILHDFDRWSKLPVVGDVEGFRIMRAA
jgi:glyoxylase-like metal-dependent hydrolase (beta-lactamase superfamily II)